MAWSSCGPRCIPPWHPRYRYLDLVFAVGGTLVYLADLGADVWMAARYFQAGDYHWGGLVMGLMGLSTLTTQFFSWAWYRSDPEEVKQKLPKDQTLCALHILQLGYLYRCLHALKVGFHVCQTKAATEEERGYAVFLTHDISLLRLFETFLESTPQLILVLYIILHMNKAETFQVVGICTSFLCIAWSLLDYHQSLRLFLHDKHKLSVRSSAVYFLSNLLLVFPRILSLTAFAVLFPMYIFLHFFIIWLVILIWVKLQGTHLMEHACFEWLYRAVVAVILYFSWFNVAEGKTRNRCIIYYTFLLLDSLILSFTWFWYNAPLSWDSPLVLALIAALPCYVLGILLRVLYYKKFHPTKQTAPPDSYDEVDHGEPVLLNNADFRHLPVKISINRRMYGLYQNFFAELLWDVNSQGNGLSEGVCEPSYAVAAVDRT